MCACVNRQKRVSHGETLRVGSSAIVYVVVLLQLEQRFWVKTMMMVMTSNAGNYT